ncbi:uncharacterized protein LOC121735001 [Aricia agestis]|uniref:uncharacterized protein LOC121735001 n=1 Tax=Aricia agestis TaxID=91739 RepID=UPI001C2088A2|nr:uncharacterized protein LOC121735001 [Aricia agestis]
MKNICVKFFEKYNEDHTLLRKFPPVQYLLRLDVMDIIDFSPELGDFLLREPLMWQKYCTEIFYACLKSCIDNSALCNLVGFSQVIIKIRLRCMPAFLLNNKEATYNSIVAYTGLLIDVSKPSDYLYYTVWSCPEECEGNEIILHHVTKTPPKCFVCRSTLYEKKGLRKYCDQVTALFQVNRDNGFCKRLIILDDLIHELKLGAMYNIHVVVLKKTSFVWSVEEIVDLPLILISPVCPDIEELYSKCEGIPWKFIYSLAISIGLNIRPLNSFMNVKINLLMSVASVKAFRVNSSPIIHFLASGHDTEYVGKLMMHAAKLADRHIVLGTSTTSATTALLAASSGVCVIPLPLQALSQKVVHSVITAIETGEVLHDIISNAKLKCAVWAHGMDLKKMMIHNVNSVFQNICRGDFGEHDDELSAFILQQAIEPVQMFEDEDILRSVAFYLDTVAGIKVVIDVEAEILLRDYFLAARKERPKYVTSGTMKALVNVCVTSARICRRSVANINDAMFAIWLHASGIPDPRFVPSEYLATPADLTRLQEVIDQFQEWLEQFTGSCIPNTYI